MTRQRRRRPTLAATDTHVCLNCGRAIHASREWFVGDDCAKKLGPARVETLRVYAEEQADPMSIPAAQRQLSPQGRLNNANARAAASGRVQLCRHDSEVGRCGSCEWEGKPENACKRILRTICALPDEQRRAERTTVQAAHIAARVAAGPPAPAHRSAPRPAPRPTQRRRRRLAAPAPSGPVQTALL